MITNQYISWIDDLQSITLDSIASEGGSCGMTYGITYRRQFEYIGEIHFSKKAQNLFVK